VLKTQICVTRPHCVKVTTAGTEIVVATPTDTGHVVHMQSAFTYQCIVHRAAKFGIPEQKKSKPHVCRVTQVLFEGSEETDRTVCTVLRLAGSGRSSLQFHPSAQRFAFLWIP